MNFPALNAVLFLIAGILVGVYFPKNGSTLFLLLAIASLCSAWFFKRSLWQGAFLGLIFFFTGSFLAQKTLHDFPSDHLVHLKLEPGEAVELRGIVRDEPTQKEFQSKQGRKMVRTTVLLEATAVGGGKVVGKVLLEGLFLDRARQWEIGDEVIAPVRIKPVDAKSGYGRYLRRQRILFSASLISAKKVEELGPSNRYQLQRKLARGRRFLEKKLVYGIDKSDHRQILMGLIFGTRAQFSEPLKALLMQTNTYHIMAISGFNMAMVILILTALLNTFGLHYRLVAILMGAVIVLYMALVGWPPSATRAGIMSLVVLSGWALNREVLSLNTVAISALLILLISPMQLFMPGFQLSYMVVLGLLFWAGPLNEKLQKWVGLQQLSPTSPIRKWGGRVILSFSVSWIAWLAVMPVILCFFGSFSLYSVLTNLLIAGIVSALTSLGIAVLILNLISVNVGLYLNEVNSLLMDGLMALLNFFGHLPGSFWQFPKQSQWWLAAYYFIMLYFLFQKMKQKPV